MCLGERCKRDNCEHEASTEAAPRGLTHVLPAAAPHTLAKGTAGGQLERWATTLSHH